MPKGAGADWDKIIFKGLTLHGIYGRRMLPTTASSLATGAITVGRNGWAAGVAEQSIAWAIPGAPRTPRSSR